MKLVAFILLLTYLTISHAGNAVELTEDNFADTTATGTHLVKFYAPWCGHCKRLAPTWDELADKQQALEDGFNVAKVDCTVHKKVCSEFGVRGYPTLKLFFNGEVIDFKGQRTIKDFEDFVAAETNPEVKAQQEAEAAAQKEKEAAEEADTGVIVLTDDNFEEKTANYNVFVKFYAPWCGHCKRLAPTWDELGALQAARENQKYLVGKVDCTVHKSVCSKHGVRGYPTLKFLRHGVAVDYSGDRSLNDLNDFASNILRTPKGEEHKLEKPAEDKKEVVESDGDVVVLTDDNFAEKTSTGSVFVKFYAPWCGHCKRLAPTWDELGALQAARENQKYLVGKVDCTVHKSVCSKHGVRGYPTLKFLRHGVAVDYSGDRSLNDLNDFASNILRTPKGEEHKLEKPAEDKKEVVESDGDVVVLTDDNFAEKTSTGSVFVKFYAPWCGHCKRLAPTWEAFSKESGDVTIAKVDCTVEKAACKEHGIRGYPTLKLFVDGTAIDYKGGRTIKDFSAFIEENGKEKSDL
eukprot:TRINITY_DN75_c1_g1_i1.p1 TRINITY_DN75_c1_g1~~TRINITY_DN75_c1_g1_i1.p1  ORF type:complete len:520 (-),score=151.18 TRINITY_DN75_c1_g1_i1:28-1587(-)